MSTIMFPAVVLMMVTMLVWLKMCIGRALAVKTLGLDAQDLVTPEKANACLSEKVQAPSNCFKNLFEVPVIFYALTAFISLSGAEDAFYLNLAWAFVGLRALQAGVHCTYNKVMHRYLAYLSSSLVLSVMLIRFFVSML